MVQTIKKLSPLEWEIMNIIWDQKKQISVRDILNAAYPEGQKAYTTIQTIMNNLESKGYLKKSKIGLVNFYYPVQVKKDIVVNETSGFVKRVYNGSFKALANYIVDSDTLSLNEIKELKKLIKQKEVQLKEK